MACSQPLTVKPKYYDKVGLLGAAHKHRTYSVPCGVCPSCKQQRVQDWVFRLQQEQKVSETTHFITLTYTEQNLPMVWSDWHNNSIGTLNPDDLKYFWKRLRRNLERTAKKNGYKPPKIKYYACGEYGELTRRPHLHAIVFNVPNDKAHEQYMKAWQLGEVFFENDRPVEPAAMAYVCKYLDKKDELHSEDVRVKPFSRMSQGIGKSYLTPKQIKWHTDLHLDRNYVILPFSSGAKAKIPKYYRSKIFTRVQRYQQAKKLEEERLKKIEEEGEDFKKINDAKEYTNVKFNKRSKRDQI